MRYFSICLLLIAGCASQTRDDYPTVWEDYDPEDTRPTYDEDYVHPSRMNADQLLERAIKAENRGRDDQARVDYHTLFRRDRWHPQGNERYQDLMLRNNLFDTVWQEYLDLWQEHPERGDAFWYHLRPMLIEREDEPVEREYSPAVSDEQRERIDALVEKAENAPDGTATLEKLNEAIEIADLPELHVRRIEIAPEDALPGLVREYADRVEDNPAGGNAYGLHGLALARTDAAKALEVLRKAWVLGLPGMWLRYALARVCDGMADGPAAGLSENELRRLRGWAMAAVRFYGRAGKSQLDAEVRLEEIRQALTANRE